MDLHIVEAFVLPFYSDLALYMQLHEIGNCRQAPNTCISAVSSSDGFQYLWRATATWKWTEETRTSTAAKSTTWESHCEAVRMRTHDSHGNGRHCLINSKDADAVTTRYMQTSSNNLMLIHADQVGVVWSGCRTTTRRHQCNEWCCCSNKRM